MGPEYKTPLEGGGKREILIFGIGLWGLFVLFLFVGFGLPCCYFSRELGV